MSQEEIIADLNPIFSRKRNLPCLPRARWERRPQSPRGSPATAHTALLVVAHALLQSFPSANRYLRAYSRTRNTGTTKHIHAPTIQPLKHTELHDESLAYKNTKKLIWVKRSNWLRLSQHRAHLGVGQTSLWFSCRLVVFFCSWFYFLCSVV